LAHEKRSVLFAFAVSSVGARHAVPERANSTAAPDQQSQPNGVFRFLVSHAQRHNQLAAQAGMPVLLKPTEVAQALLPARFH